MAPDALAKIAWFAAFRGSAGSMENDASGLVGLETVHAAMLRISTQSERP